MLFSLSTCYNSLYVVEKLEHEGHIPLMDWMCFQVLFYLRKAWYIMHRSQCTPTHITSYKKTVKNHRALNANFPSINVNISQSFISNFLKAVFQWYVFWDWCDGVDERWGVTGSCPGMDKICICMYLTCLFLNKEASSTESNVNGDIRWVYHSVTDKYLTLNMVIFALNPNSDVSMISIKLLFYACVHTLWPSLHLSFR